MVPTFSALWASEPPMAAMPSSSASAGARPLQRRSATPPVVGLKPSMPSGWKMGSASSMSLRMVRSLAHSGYGSRGCAMMARPPCSWILAMLSFSECQGRMRSLM